MPVSYAEARNIVFLKSAVLSRSLFTEKKGTYERNHQSNRAAHDIATPVEDSPWRARASESGEPKLVVEWQRGVEILGHAQRKLRLAFATAQFSAGTC